MRFIHISDLHLGISVHEISMLPDQEYMLLEILRIIDEEKADALFIAGDIYDKAVPPAGSVRLYDNFLTMLSAREIPVFAISGNHDSPERTAFGAELFRKSGVHFSPVFDGSLSPVTLSDEFGEIQIYMLPFIKPAHVRRFFPDKEIDSHDRAVSTVLEGLELDAKNRNVLIAHQFVTGAKCCDSDDISVGGLDQVSAGAFRDFDYVALGHLHSPQYVGRETLRYCGTPLKYSFSEAGHEKSVTVVDMGSKGDVKIQTVPLPCRRDLREIRGSYEELTLRDNYFGTATDDYLHIILTDESELPNALGRLRAVYPNVMKLSYDNAGSRAARNALIAGNVSVQSPIELFSELFEKQNGSPMNPEQIEIVSRLIRELEEVEP